MGCSSSTNALVHSEAPFLQKKEDEYVVYPEGAGPFSTVDGTAEVPIRYAKSGLASEEVAPTTTLTQIFKEACAKKPDKIAMRVERPLPAPENGVAPPALPADQWTSWTYKQYYDDTCKLAKAMVAVGHQVHEAVNIFGFNSPEWFMGQMAAVVVGGKAAGIYPTDTPDQVQFKVTHSHGSIALVEDQNKLKPFLNLADKMPNLKAIVCWACAVPEGGKITRSDGSEIKCYTWDDFMKLADSVEDSVLEERMNNQKPGHCCTLIYTSGTTGNPKAVMISHDNILFESACVLQILPNCREDKAERVVSYLPLSHVAGLLVDIISPIVSTAKTPSWIEVSFARPYDLKIGSVGDRLRSVKPTLFLGVPRVWEKIAEKMKAIGAQTKGLKKKISTWAKSKGLEHARNCNLGGSGVVPSNYARAEKLVLSKVKLALGLEECKFGFTGAAPIALETLEYFGQLGIQINEVYGMSECTGATTFSTDEAHQWGSCGWEMPGCEVKVFQVNPDDLNDKKECDPVEDIFNAPEENQGEICYRGRHIMMGYMANPALGEEHVKEIQKKCDDAIDRDGWLHSGDKGCISVKGMVKITGRYKELIIGAGGENIAPVPIEDTAKQECPAISNIMMVGDKRKFNVALVTLKAEGATGDLPGGDNLTGDALKVTDATTISGACKDEAFIKAVTDALVRTNKKAPNNASAIQKFTILPQDFSVETEELTPTLKLKRGFVEKKHLAFIDSMYESKDTFVPYPSATSEEKTE
mmetsp:Transcript_31410/g.61216  ORF Transcript_31410/g.61216 Transcript_31410/m.61216 type:complete len:754 (-) Transcript_31410:236-2497(-)|eukprot:CAMPEP_0175144818 /NCGR_PEP_ID=MMETSP0087-20121206/14383_1 /TAXON_ID=136419 /ORGANISM="Unknown Unknown, Strain D1" /LENGTH=753 /DNA_ID=CAMNT_0016429409 /DNA_START=30 /DNA_END=2291 /DNA_ORIENTATION=-